MNDSSLIPFGKYKGQKLANIPASYLLWLYNEGKLFADLKSYIEANMDVLKAEVNKEFKK